ncbi:MAG: efflux RND transporter periplasmic adaptor subunit [Bacteroidales bacterium]|jgi:RND family efflux transporter MFP subunit|nr:efflux RND transporter periplasmic adaptor subunit [Bacteroidales bacterium]
MQIHNLVLALLTAIAVMSCSQKPGGTSEEHGHDENLFLTGYSNDFEVFAEATPFVVGQQSDILAHFSYLENFKPLKEGSITVSLIVGTDGVRQTIEKPLRDGIFQFSIKPATIGTGKLIFDITTPDKTSQIILSDIKIYDDEHDAQHAAIDAVVESSNGVFFYKEQSWKVDFATEEIKYEPFGQIIRTTAQIQPSQIDEKVVVAKASGIVLFSNDDIVDGKAVNTGQSMFSIESSGLADNNMDVRYSEVVSEYNKTKADYERKKELAKDRIVSERDLLETETAYKNAEVVYHNLRKNFSSGKQVISSPMNGFVKQVLVRNGEYAEAGQPVLIVSQNNDLLIKAELQPKYFDVLSSIVSANLKVMNSNLSYTLDELNGKVVSFGKSTYLNNPLIPVVFQVRNNIGLLPGSFVEMYIKLQTNNNALVVPNGAIVEEMGTYFVFVQLTPEYFEKRPVKKGTTDGFRTEIIEGIYPNERVVSKGAILVKLAQASGALDAHSGHVH